MKPMTMYVSESLYTTYQSQAQKRGRKTSELIRDAMELYAKTEFRSKKSFDSLNFDFGVKLKSGAIDFLKDNWQEDFMDSRFSDGRL